MSRPPLRDVRKIAVLRPNAIGDFVFCLPALHALRHRYPAAKLYYLGLPWHAAFLADRSCVADQVLVMPSVAGITQAAPGETGPDAARFAEQLRDLQFDLAIQMFGGGRFANPFLASIGARLTVGMRTPDAAPLDRTIAYAGPVNRRLQLLEVAALAGAQFWPMQQELHTTPEERRRANALLPVQPGQRLVIIQPGATDGRRCWPASRFAAVADALAEEGATVAINGSEREWGLAETVIQTMRHDAINLAGKATLPVLCGLLERAELVVSNDTGPLHLALALGTPSAGIYWLTNFIESAPLRQAGHRAAISLRTRCPMCGMENIAQRCEHDVSFVDDVQLDEVAAMAIELFRGSA